MAYQRSPPRSPNSPHSPQQQYGPPPPAPNQQQYGRPPPAPQQQQQVYGQQRKPQQQHYVQANQQYLRQQQHQQQLSGQQTPNSPTQEDHKEDEEAKKLAEAKRRAIIKSEDVHFNFYDEVQFGIPNFPHALAEIGVLCSKTKKKGLIIGCGSGRLVFEMAKHFNTMDGIDTNTDLIEAAKAFKTTQNIEWQMANHGNIVDEYKISATDLKCDASILSKCTFAPIKDLRSIPFKFNGYDCIIVLNVLDKLHQPKKFVNIVQRRVKQKGILIFSECYNWKEDIAPMANWIGGIANKTSSDALKEILPSYYVVKEDKMTYIKRRNAFSFELCIANTLILKKV